MTTNRPLKVFLCHSSADKPAVRELYQKLRAEPWIDPWLDEEELFPGMDWNMEIEKAIEATDVILVCLSNSSITKEGYVQREIRIALDYADYKPDGTLFIIPVRLEECTPPKRLSRWQYADYFEGNHDRSLQRLLVSLKRRGDSLGLHPERPASVAQVSNPTKKVGQKVAQAQSLPYVPSSTNTLSNGMTFIFVPAGKFLIGSSKDNKLSYTNERPQSTIEITYDYWIARFPVTNEIYNSFVEAKRITHPVDKWEGKRNHPVTHISWNEANIYCRWLSGLLKKEFPADLVIRLPTEAEWEKAARGVDGREYPWGNEFDENKCNTIHSSKGETTPVGLYSPQGDSPYGLADMAGNVWEWVHSLLEPYPYNLNDGRENEIVTGVRVQRGGSFFHIGDNARCASRFGDNSQASAFIGFRVCLAPPLPK